jgi:anion-transporting  ArsA/GET3 family ATPase
MPSGVAASLLDRRLVFVTGKGGVGKTSVAAALAHTAAARGKRTLVCEMDAKGSLAAAFDAAPLTFVPREIEPNLFAMAMNTEDSLREYLRLFVRLPFVGKIGPLARTFDFVADAAPGVKEILSVGKLCHEVRQRNYDLVVVDAEATGHIVAQIGAPSVIRDLVKVGLIRDQTDWMLDILRDPATTGVVVVATPEEMPVTETLELIGRLEPQTGVATSIVIANRVLPELVTGAEIDVLAGLDDHDAIAVLTTAVGRGASTIVQAAQIADARSRVGAGHLAELTAGIGDLSVVEVPELFTRSTGRRVVALIGETLARHPSIVGEPEGTG